MWTPNRKSDPECHAACHEEPNQYCHCAPLVYHPGSDLIVVMDHGKVAECGSHEELIDRKGKYYDLYMTQYAGFAT